MATLPSAGLYVDDALVQTYQDGIDQLIADMGRTVTLNMEPSKIRCPNCVIKRVGRKFVSTGRYKSGNPNPVGGALNKPFTSGICPVCRGNGVITTPETFTFTALINWKPKDVDFNIEGRTLENVVRTKCLREDNEDRIKKSISATVDGVRVKLFRGPISRGIRDLRYVESFWQIISNG